MLGTLIIPAVILLSFDFARRRLLSKFYVNIGKVIFCSFDFFLRRKVNQVSKPKQTFFHLKYSFFLTLLIFGSVCRHLVITSHDAIDAWQHKPDQSGASIVSFAALWVVTQSAYWGVTCCVTTQVVAARETSAS